MDKINMNIQCPACKHISNVPFAVTEGQHLKCPYCSVKFKYGYTESKVILETQRKSPKAPTIFGTSKKTTIKTIVAVTLVLLFVYSCYWLINPASYDGNGRGDGWYAKKEIVNSEESRIKIIVQGNKIKLIMCACFPHLKDYGCMIVVDQEYQRVSFLVPDMEETKSKSDGKIWYEEWRRVEDIWQSENWNDVKKEIYHLSKRKTAEEIIDYLQKNRRNL